MPPAVLALLASSALALMLARRGLSAHRLAPTRMLVMALAWAGIIATLALVLQRLGPS